MSFSSEDQMICTVSRVQLPTRARKHAARLLDGRLDWNYILESSVQHGVAPLFWHGLKQVCDPQACIPGQVVSELCDLYSRNHARNRRLYCIVGDIVRELGSRGVEVLALKDLQLAQVVYPSVALRPIGDVDLLIHREQYDKVAAGMRKLGFVPPQGTEIPYTQKYAWGHHFRRADDNVWIDVQWKLLQMEWDVCREGNFDFDITRMWRNAERLSINDYEILVPCPEDMLFHLCMHLEGHHYCELILLCDIAEFLRYYAESLDWKYLLAIARKYQVRSSLYYVLRLAKNLLDAPLDDELLNEFAPSYFKANLFAPLYDNLTYVHAALDELGTHAAPPEPLMLEFEMNSRRQAVIAQHYYRELDGFAVGCQQSGNELLLFDGELSEKIYPDDSLEPFRPIDCFVLKHNIPIVSHVLQLCGYEHDTSGAHSKTVSVHTRDRLLANAPLPFRVSFSIDSDFAALAVKPTLPKQSKADIARKMLVHKLGRRPAQGHTALVRVHGLTAEQLLVVLALRFAQRSRERLFNMCSLLEFFRTRNNGIDLDAADQLARRLGLEKQLEETLAAVSEFPDVKLSNAISLGSASRMLGSARYDLEQNGRYAAFKHGFLIALVLLSLRGVNNKIRYVVQILRREFAHGCVLAELKSALCKLRTKPANARAFAYWTELPGSDVKAPPPQTPGGQLAPNSFDPQR